MGIEDQGVGGESKGAVDLLNPQSSILDPEVQPPDPVYLERVRWRCRRGLLELDIVLGRFIEQRYAALDERQRAAFDELLDLPDTELWDAITGKIEPPHAQQRTVLKWLKEV